MAHLTRLVCVLLVLLGSARADIAIAQEDSESIRVLVFTKTAGFRHSSIPEGVEAFSKICVERDWAIEHTEDAAAFTDENLSGFDAVVFLNTTGDVLDDEQQAAFERFIQSGKGYMGVHAAADTEYEWPWYAKLVGAQFKSHPRIQQAIIRVVNREHASTRHLGADWTRTDEWYDFRAVPSEDVSRLLELDESSYEGGSMGEDHPIAWYHEYDGGRAFYTGGGHTEESYSEPDFAKHLAGGLAWVLEETE